MPSYSGLGAGLIARALDHHGVNLTICEIDPVVYEFAREYFAVPEPAQVVLGDAKEWLTKRGEGEKVSSTRVRKYSRADDESLVQNKPFDYIVHDVVSNLDLVKHGLSLTRLLGVHHSSRVAKSRLPCSLESFGRPSSATCTTRASSPSISPVRSRRPLPNSSSRPSSSRSRTAARSRTTRRPVQTRPSATTPC